MMQKKKTWRIILLIAVLIVVMAGMYAVYRQFSQKAQTGKKEITISIVFDDGTQKDYTLETDAEYLKDALESVADIDGEEGEYGYTLYTVDGVHADFTNGNAYWDLYVNGEYGTYSLSQQPIADGDSYTIAYEQY